MCPRCHVELDGSTFDGLPLEMCGTCMGALIRQRDLVRLLDALSSAVAEEISHDQEITPVTDHAGHANCPGCGDHMSTFGYMGSKLVTVDRCNRCALIWTDSEELSVMATLFARTNHRRTLRQAEQDGWQEEMNQRVSRLLRWRGVLGLLPMMINIL